MNLLSREWQWEHPVSFQEEWPGGTVTHPNPLACEVLPPEINCVMNTRNDTDEIGQTKSLIRPLTSDMVQIKNSFPQCQTFNQKISWNKLLGCR